jgi:hypothetical protein
MRKAMDYACGLRDLAKLQDLIVVDCISVLRKLPKSATLQHDGFHLSVIGQEVVSQAIAESIMADALMRPRAR